MKDRAQTHNQRYPLRFRINIKTGGFQYTVYDTSPEHGDCEYSTGFERTRGLALKEARIRMRILRARQ